MQNSSLNKMSQAVTTNNVPKWTLESATWLDRSPFALLRENVRMRSIRAIIHIEIKK